MCHSADARPPAAPTVTGEAAEHGPLQITAEDGNRFLAYRAVPSVPNGRSLLLLPDYRGLHPFYEALAQRFAEAGFHTLAVDHYGRTAGTDPRDGDFDGFAHMKMLRPEHVEADATAALAVLREQGGGDGRPVFSLGFCLGGGYSWRLATHGLGLAGSIGFYGPPRFFGGRAEQLSAPLLMLLGGDDEVTSQAEFDAMADSVADAGKEVEMRVYDGAPHSFFDAEYDRWRDACTDSWDRVLDFTARHS